MYRHILTLLVFLFSSSVVSAWGLFDECLLRPNGATENTCLMEALVAAGQRPTVTLSVVDNQNRSEEESAALQESVRDKAAFSLNAWLRSTRRVISKTNRQDEFKDFLAAFPKFVNVKLQQEGEPADPNLHIEITVGHGCGIKMCALTDVFAHKIHWYSHVWQQSPAKAVGKCQAEPHVVLAHEMGHLLGFADLYQEDSDRSSHLYGVNKNFSLWAVGVEPQTMGMHSIMGKNNGEELNQFGCADADAMVNLYDIWKYINDGEETPRWKDGWDSFCSSYQGIRYAYGQPFRKKSEKKANKKRLEAAKFFKTAYASWIGEYDRIDKNVASLEKHLASAPRPLNTMDLLQSAKLEYLKNRRAQVASVSAQLKKFNPSADILGFYAVVQRFLASYKGIAPGSSLYDFSVLQNYKPRTEDLKNTGIRTAPTYKQLWAQLLRENANSQTPDKNLARSFALATPVLTETPKPAATTEPEEKAALVPADTRVEIQIPPAVTAVSKPAEGVSAQQPEELHCAICGQKIENKADAYFPPETGRGPVHKHSECAYKYFARFYPTDDASLKKYNDYYFFSEPADVTAAKGLMKKLGLTPAEVKEYAEAARVAAREAARKQREKEERDRIGAQLKEKYEYACARALVKVTQEDKEKFIQDHSAELQTIRTKQSKRKKLTRKEREFYRQYQQMIQHAIRQQWCDETRAAWQKFNEENEK